MRCPPGISSADIPRRSRATRRWKEPIIAPHENVGRHIRPRLESAGRSKHGIRLARFALRPGLVNHRLWHVVEKVYERIERSVSSATIAHILLALRLSMASIPPPLTGSFAGLRDHRIDQHQHCDLDLLAHERQRKAGQRLRNQDHAFWISIADRADDRSSVLWKTRAVIRRWQIDWDRLMIALLQLRCNQVPVPCASARARNKDKREALDRLHAVVGLS